jgi:type IV secretion system protein VirB9
MKRLAAVLLAGATLAAGPAYALREPTPSKLDPHIGHVPYNADDVVHLPAKVGHEITIVLAPDESIPAGNVAVSDKTDLRALPAANVLFLKPVRAMDPQPITVRAVLPDGTARLHVFQFDAHDPGTGNYFYKVQVDYPREEAAARAAAFRRRRQEAAERRSAELLRAPAAFAPNKSYVGQGDAAILPTREMWDDGQFTYVRLPGHARIPGFWAINPDGKPALVSDFNKVGDIVSLPRTAAAWHLRDGDAVLYVWNLVYNPVGNDTGTGTVSPDIERTVKVRGVPVS